VISPYEAVLRIFIAALMGGVLGFERETHGRPAGFRTHLLVAISAALLMIVSEYYHYISYMNPAYVRVDPGRIAAGATTGIGFLGAGVIIKARGTVYGLTTAACIWSVFALGLAVGAGLYIPAIAAFVLGFVVLWFLRLVEYKFPKDVFKTISVTCQEGLEEDKFRSVIARYGRPSAIEYDNDIEKKELLYQFTASFKTNASFAKLFRELSALQGVKKVKLGVPPSGQK
jgi:putative Mg2+ transporter-C (MgtC) family protein